MISPSPSPAPAETAARWANTLEGWKRKLLDLSKRNRALHFRPQKVSTVTIADEQPAEVFRRLYLLERAMRFRPAPEPPTRETSSTTKPVAVQEAITPALKLDVGQAPSLELTLVLGVSPTELAEELDENPGLELDFQPYEAAALETRHTDDWLQTTSPAEGLDRSLRRLDEQARLNLEEQGVNTLFLALGMLHYKEEPEAEEVFKAPLVLLPVALERRSARSGYSLRATDEDPAVNPALTEHLRLRFGLSLPPLPESNQLTESYDLQTCFQQVSEVIAEQKGWSVKTDLYLAPFSFQKLAMYKDLEAQAEALRAHPLLAALLERRQGAALGLPAEIEALVLDRDCAPETTYHVVDADNSQLKALAAVALGHNLVIEGPPGTGKSQTITNLIAQALARGQRVLFVAEKMAALEVVHRRLIQAGLGELCLELHSSRAKKREVMREIGLALDASLAPVPEGPGAAPRLGQVRGELSGYVAALHEPAFALAASPFQILGELVQVQTAPKVTWSGSAESLTRGELDEAVRQLDDLAVSAADLREPPHSHPFRDAGRTLYLPDEIERIAELAAALAEKLEALAAAGERAGAELGCKPPATFEEVEKTLEVASVVRRSPGAPRAVLSNDAWNAPPGEALRLIEEVREFRERQAWLVETFLPEAFGQRHAADVIYIERKLSGLFGFLAFFDGRFRSVRRRWRAYLRPGASPLPLLEQARQMAALDDLAERRQALRAASARGEELFGGLWRAEDSHSEELAAYVSWVVEFRAVFVRQHLAEQATSIAKNRQPSLGACEALAELAGNCRQQLPPLTTLVGWPSDLIPSAPFTESAARLSRLAQHARWAPEWAAFETTRQRGVKTIGAELLPAALKGEIPFSSLSSALRRAVFSSWLATVFRERLPLAEFRGRVHGERLAEFRRLDRQVLLDNRKALIKKRRTELQASLQEPALAPGLGILQRELAKQRSFAPLRRTLRLAHETLGAIKPCYLMSPLTVAQYLEGGTPSFDLVIFDEASQLPTEDAVGALLRGRQWVVVGDPKQLPPTNFFTIGLNASAAPLGDDGSPLYEDSESILEELMGSGLPTARLKWHYRSAHEDLIHFSNVTFYDADLHTFPSAEKNTHGLSFHFVEEAAYVGNGINPGEAQRVADEVVRFAREQIAAKNRGELPMSLGVGTFSQRQQMAISDELEARRRAEPALEPFFDRGSEEPFFVKNLENIQGDERDVIFLSVTYGRGTDGRLLHRFGPLNQANGWRRLNVLVTRARRAMRVFSSMRGDEISLAQTDSTGARLLRNFLLYAERGELENTLSRLRAEQEHTFERQLGESLRQAGLALEPQVGAAACRIDLAISDDAVPGRFLCGIECDGDDYARSPTARDRDRLRDEVLAQRGWEIHRVWSADWFKDQAGQRERLLAAIAASRTRALERATAEAQTQERLAAQVAADHATAAANHATAAANHAAEEEQLRQELATLAASQSETEYERPIAAPYTLAPGEGRFRNKDLLAAPEAQLLQALVKVVTVESPIHEADLLSRVAGFWSTRLGSRIEARLREVLARAERGRLIERRGEFCWSPGQKPDAALTPRSRSGLKMLPERIAPEEYEAAVRRVVGNGQAFSFEELIQEARAVLGFGRTSAAVEEQLRPVVEKLLATGELGQGASGIRRRQ